MTRTVPVKGDDLPSVRVAVFQPDLVLQQNLPRSLGKVGEVTHSELIPVVDADQDRDKRVFRLGHSFQRLPLPCLFEGGVSHVCHR